MKVVCDNCRAVYKVPDDKLTKAVNKATCRNCGHRMLIPRPKPNADPEERTLVTAVPPTPVGAPPRAIDPRGNEPRLGDLEIAHSSQGPDDLRMATPMAAPRVDQTLPGPESDFDGPDTKLSVSPSEQEAARRSSPSLPPGRNPPVRRPSMPPAVATPPGASAHGQQGVSQGRRSTSGIRETPVRDTTRDTPRPAPPARSAPPPRSGAYPAMALHDPANDLNWALLGTTIALIGGFLLAFLSLGSHPVLTPMVMWFGLGMMFGGSLLTFMVLLTGARGRRPAKTLFSLLFGSIFAFVASTMIVATKMSVEKLIDISGVDFSEAGLRNGTSVPSALPSQPLAAVGNLEPPALPVPAPESVAAANVAPPPPEPAAQPPVRTAPPPPAVRPPAPATRTLPEPIPVPVAQPAVPIPIPVPATPPPPPPPPTPVPTPQPTVGGMQTVPMEVIYVMLTNNIEVKKCFVSLMRSGAAPPQIDLKFNIMPEGRATNAMVLQSNFRGTDFEACLVKAVTGITFPPTTGSGTSITFPFVLQ